MKIHKSKEVANIEFRKYLTSQEGEILQLKCRNLKNVNVIALIIVETYYRKLLFRLLEYLYWVISGNNEITLGLSQLKARYIKTFSKLSIFQRFNSILKLESYVNNYFLVESYLNKNNMMYADDNSICKFYNGEASSIHYMRNFKEAKSYIKTL